MARKIFHYRKMEQGVFSVLQFKKISFKAYASVLGISEKSAHNKANEQTEFTLSEALTIKRGLFPEYEFDYLFASDRGA